MLLLDLLGCSRLYRFNGDIVEAPLDAQGRPSGKQQEPIVTGPGSRAPTMKLHRKAAKRKVASYYNESNIDTKLLYRLFSLLAIISR